MEFQEDIMPKALVRFYFKLLLFLFNSSFISLLILSSPSFILSLLIFFLFQAEVTACVSTAFPHHSNHYASFQSLCIIPITMHHSNHYASFQSLCIIPITMHHSQYLVQKLQTVNMKVTYHLFAV